MHRVATLYKHHKLHYFVFLNVTTSNTFNLSNCIARFAIKFFSFQQQKHVQFELNGVHFPFVHLLRFRQMKMYCQCAFAHKRIITRNARKAKKRKVSFRYFKRKRNGSFLVHGTNAFATNAFAVYLHKIISNDIHFMNMPLNLVTDLHRLEVSK